jgi:F-type H+-transporting ATPase subunit epsilon
MATIQLEVVSAERLVFSGEVEKVVAPGAQGQLGVLPHHAPLMTLLDPGELMVTQDGSEICIAVTGGFMEVRPDHIIILADAAERADEIDIERAEEAKRRAEERLRGEVTEVDLAKAEVALKRSLMRLRAVQRMGTHRRNRPQGPPPV